jgi:hypothetical protein
MMTSRDVYLDAAYVGHGRRPGHASFAIRSHARNYCELLIQGSHRPTQRAAEKSRMRSLPVIRCRSQNVPCESQSAIQVDALSARKVSDKRLFIVSLSRICGSQVKNLPCIIPAAPGSPPTLKPHPCNSSFDRPLPQPTGHDRPSEQACFRRLVLGGVVDGAYRGPARCISTRSRSAGRSVRHPQLDGCRRRDGPPGRRGCFRPRGSGPVVP